MQHIDHCHLSSEVYVERQYPSSDQEANGSLPWEGIRQPNSYWPKQHCTVSPIILCHLLHRQLNSTIKKKTKPLWMV